MVDKPAGLRGGRAAAMVEELIGTPHHARRVGIFPIGEKCGIDQITALGGLHEGKIDAIPARSRPVNRALPDGNVDAMHGVRRGQRPGPILGWVDLFKVWGKNLHGNWGAWLRRLQLCLAGDKDETKGKKAERA
jgi:hypothetical protein